jgi:Ca2+-binding RTX toxin-like protein
VTITGFDANDRLVINGLGGDDVITANGAPLGMLLTASGGDGDDVLIGGPGQDVLDGGPGGNVVIQSALLTQFMASTFAPAGQGLGSTPLPDNTTNQAPLLAQPHA